MKIREVKRLELLNNLNNIVLLTANTPNIIKSIRELITGKETRFIRLMRVKWR